VGGDASLSPALHVAPWAAYLSADSAETRLPAGASLASRERADKTLQLNLSEFCLLQATKPLRPILELAVANITSNAV
jgi:hypothetical protein